MIFNMKFTFPLLLASLLLLTSCANIVLPRKAEPELVLKNLAGTYVDTAIIQPGTMRLAFTEKEHSKRIALQRILQNYQCGSAIPKLPYDIKDFALIKRLGGNDFSICFVQGALRIGDIAGYSNQVKAFVLSYRGSLSSAGWLFPSRYDDNGLSAKLASPDIRKAGFVMNDGQFVPLDTVWEGKLMMLDNYNMGGWFNDGLRTPYYSVNSNIRLPFAERSGYTFDMSLLGSYKLETLIEKYEKISK